MRALLLTALSDDPRQQSRTGRRRRGHARPRSSRLCRRRRRLQPLARGLRRVDPRPQSADGDGQPRPGGSRRQELRVQLDGRCRRPARSRDALRGSDRVAGGPARPAYRRRRPRQARSRTPGRPRPVHLPHGVSPGSTRRRGRPRAGSHAHPGARSLRRGDRGQPRQRRPATRRRLPGNPASATARTTRSMS